MNFSKVINSKITWIVLILIICILSIILIFYGKDTKEEPKKNIDTVINEKEVEKDDEEESIKKEITYNFELNGKDRIVIFVGDTFEDPGVLAIDSNNEDVSNNVVQTGTVDTSIPGIYTLKYTLNINDYTKTLTRIVNVIEKKEELSMSIIGSSPTYLNINEEYEELGVKALLNDKDVSNEVKIKNDIENKVGNYTVTYSYNDKNITRQIIRIDIDSYFKVDNAKMLIEVNTDDNIKYIVTPDGIVNTNKAISYKVSKEGKYLFTLYTDDLKEYLKEVTVVKEEVKPEETTVKPETEVVNLNATCTATLKGGKTTFKVTSTSKNIKSYNYNGIATKTANTYTANKYIRDKAYVTLTDTSGNTKKITCTSKMVALPVKKPSGTLKYKAESSTLKVYIKEKSGFYLAYIWAKDPLYQLRKQMISGTTFQKPSDILQSGMNSTYSKKIVLGFNASGSVGGKYYKSIYSKNSKYNGKEPTPLLIYNGKVVINDYKGLAANYGNTYYLDGNNNLKYFTNPSLKSKSSSERQKIFQNIIDSGTRNTFGFEPMLIYNGKLNESAYLNGAEYNAYRQGICQVDSNNFIVVSSKSGKIKGTKAFGEFMLSLGCKTAFNLDGGGSHAMLYKPSNTSSVKVLTGNERKLSNVLYFTEYVK